MQVFVEKGRENNERTNAYYERNFEGFLYFVTNTALFGTKPPDIRPVLQNGCFLVVLYIASLTS